MSAGAHSFETLFDQPPHVVGREAGVVALVAPRRDPIVHAASANAAGPARSVYVIGEESRWGTWVDYVQGVTVALREEGYGISGFDVLVRSDDGCPAKTLVVALLRALRDAFALGFDDETLPVIAERAENVFARGAVPRAITAR